MKKYHIILGLLSFLLGLTFLLKQLYLTELWSQIMYYAVIVILLYVLQTIFVRKNISVVTAYKISNASWVAGFILGYGIHYIKFK